MAKPTTTFVCQQCGTAYPKWQGKCPSCNSWGSLVETLTDSSITAKSNKREITEQAKNAQIIALASISDTKLSRASTGIGEFDRVLGGGIVPGMAVLLAGEPGIGKSTLLLELASKLAQRKAGSGKRKEADTNQSELNASRFPLNARVLYVAGEESPQQIKIRADRLGIATAGIELLAETNVDIIAAVIGHAKPSYIIVDSVQTLKTEDLTSTFGSVGQVRECVDRLTMLAKKIHTPIFFIGHVTKEGSIAGPKVLEHIVDTVLVLEGDEAHNFRILRAQKNRFGSTDEVGVFAMEEEGLIQIENPSQLFLEQRLTNVPGSIVVPTIEGTRPILVEIQALTAPTTLALPRRVGIGVDYNRLQLLLAILSRRFHNELAKLDVFVNVAGGLKINEPALDLGVCLAIASAYTGKPIPETTACFGEVGLLGEVRKVRYYKQRQAEAKRLGYQTIIGPEQVNSLSEALRQVFK